MKLVDGFMVVISLNDNHQISFCHSPMQYGIKLYT